MKSKVRFLSQVKIGSLMFQIRCKPRLHLDKQRVDGFVKESSSEIYIDSELDPEYFKTILLHEISHALLFSAGLTKSLNKMSTDDIEECFVVAFSYGIYAVLKDNPDLRYFLYDQESFKLKYNKIVLSK